MIIKTMSSLSFFQKSAVSPLASSRVFALFPRGGSSSRLFHNNSFVFFFLFTDISLRIHTRSSQRRSITILYYDKRLSLRRCLFVLFFFFVRVSDHPSTGSKLTCADVAFVFLVDRPQFISSRSGMDLIRCDENKAIWFSCTVTIDL